MPFLPKKGGISGFFYFLCFRLLPQKTGDLGPHDLHHLGGDELQQTSFLLLRMGRVFTDFIHHPIHAFFLQPEGRSIHPDDYFGVRPVFGGSEEIKAAKRPGFVCNILLSTVEGS